MKENKILFTQALHIQRKDEYKSLYAFARLLPLCELHERALRRKKPYLKNTTGQRRKNMVYMYTIIQMYINTATSTGSRVPRKGDRHAGDIRQDQSSGRE